jgi:hypothetical protein
MSSASNILVHLPMKYLLRLKKLKKSCTISSIVFSHLKMLFDLVPTLMQRNEQLT